MFGGMIQSPLLMRSVTRRYLQSVTRVAEDADESKSSGLTWSNSCALLRLDLALAARLQRDQHNPGQQEG